MMRVLFAASAVCLVVLVSLFAIVLLLGRQQPAPATLAPAGGGVTYVPQSIKDSSPLFACYREEGSLVCLDFKAFVQYIEANNEKAQEDNTL